MIVSYFVDRISCCKKGASVRVVIMVEFLTNYYSENTEIVPKKIVT